MKKIWLKQSRKSTKGIGMNIESLASKVKFLAQQYREDKALVSKCVFSKPENNLRRFAPDDDYFSQKLFLPSLENGRPDEFLQNIFTRYKTNNLPQN